MSKGETQNNRAIDLNDWFVVVKELRDGATHSNFTIKTSRMNGWSKGKREMLSRYFPGINTEQGYQLGITYDNAKLSLELFSEYSFQIYKFLSISRGYDWGILQQ